MEQFSLEKWLENKDRRITTRYGNRTVRIIAYDRVDSRPIVALVKTLSDGKEFINDYTKNGWHDLGEKYPDKYDLFFADEEEIKFSDFERGMQELINTCCSQIEKIEKQDEKLDGVSIFVKENAKRILELARKELEENYYTKVLDDKMVLKCELHEQHLQTAYDIGKQEALEKVPEWKRFNFGDGFNNRLVIIPATKFGTVIYNSDTKMFLTAEDLEQLPRENMEEQQ